MKKMCKIASGLLFVSVMVSNAYAGGIALGTTRVIYPQGDKQVSLPVINSSTNNAFLVQSWVANADQSKSSDFILTPPLFVMHPKKENTIRIMYVGPDLPTDRESVFYLNSKATCAETRCKLPLKASLNYLYALKSYRPLLLMRRKRFAAGSLMAKLPLPIHRRITSRW